MKKCYHCKETKPKEDFYKNKSRADGLQSHCKVCHKAKKKQHYEANKGRYLENSYSWRKRNPDKAKEIRKRHYDNNTDACKERSRLWSLSNPEKKSQLWDDWYRSNIGHCRSRSAKRRASKKQATPDWLTEEQHKQIQDIYQHARDCELVSGEKYHVDHIIPLQGENISGLHVPWNLQVLPADLNIAKSNSYG